MTEVIGDWQVAGGRVGGALVVPAAAVWIGPAHPFDLHEVYLRFRSPASWRLGRRPRQAELFITADSRYKLWVNGRFVGRGPARCFPESQAVDRLDITRYLRAGQNVLAALVYQPGYSHFAYVHRGAAGLLAYLVGDGQVVLATDSRWRVSRDESASALVPRVSIYGSGVEERDLRREEPWVEAAFDDSTWPQARLAAAAGGAPWLNLRPRQLPLLVEREVEGTLLERRRGKLETDEPGGAHEALRSGWLAAAPVPTNYHLGAASSAPTNQPSDQPAPGRGKQRPDERTDQPTNQPTPGSGKQRPDERTDQPTNQPTSQPANHAAGWFGPALAEGEAAYWLVDLGRDYTCQGWAEIKGATGQERVAVSYGEKMRDGRLVLPDPEDYCRVRLTDRCRLRRGRQVVETFALRGGRYLLWQVTGPTGPDFRFRPRVRVAEYPLPGPRPLVEGDELLAQVVSLCEGTVRACLQDGFVDCVWREGAQWLGDALPQSLALWSMTEDTRPIRQILVMAAAGAYPDGILPSVVPAEVHAYTIVRYNFMWVELLHFYYQITGDDALVERLWPTLARMLARVAEFRTEVGLGADTSIGADASINADARADTRVRPYTNPPGRRFYIDYSATAQSDPHAVYNLHFLLALQLATGLAEGQGHEGDGRRWRESARALRQTVRAAFYHDGRWYDDLARTTFSQLGSALAILTEAARPEERPGLLDEMAARSLDARDEHSPEKMVLASPFMHHYVLEALRQEGRLEEVAAIIRRRWGRWVEAGYPTTWENWNVDFPDGSQCHAFSAHPRYHLAEIARARGGWKAGQQALGVKA